MTLTLLISGAISLIIIVAAPALIHLLFGEAFVRGAGVARILLVAAVPLSANRAIEGVLRGIGRPLDAGIAEIVALAATVVGLAVLLPLLGLTGAALSSLVAYLVAMVWMTRRATRALGMPAPATLRARPPIARCGQRARMRDLLRRPLGRL